jgi:hypothetical protein
MEGGSDEATWTKKTSIKLASIKPQQSNNRDCLPSLEGTDTGLQMILHPDRKRRSGQMGRRKTRLDGEELA